MSPRNVCLELPRDVKTLASPILYPTRLLQVPRSLQFFFQDIHWCDFFRVTQLLYPSATTSGLLLPLQAFRLPLANVLSLSSAQRIESHYLWWQSLALCSSYELSCLKFCSLGWLRGGVKLLVKGGLKSSELEAVDRKEVSIFF